jgi:hypothetical protein
LDPDVERLLRNSMRERGLSFKEALNESIRTGLESEKRSRSRRFVQKTFRLGAEQEFRWDKALDTAAAMEDEAIVGKLSMRK